MANQLETQITDIVARTAIEISQAVRASLLEDIARLIGDTGGSTTVHSATAAKRGRKPGAKAEKSTKEGGVRSGGLADRRRKGWSESDVEKVLGFITSQPGLRSEQIGRQLKMGPKVLFKVLAKLRETGKVAVKGYGRGGIYSPA